LTFRQVAVALSGVVQVDVALDPLKRPLEPERRIMAEWFEREGYRADIDRLRQLIPELTDFETWASIMMGCLAC